MYTIEKAFGNPHQAINVDGFRTTEIWHYPDGQVRMIIKRIHGELVSALCYGSSGELQVRQKYEGGRLVDQIIYDGRPV